jgi:hypothetical protein
MIRPERFLPSTNVSTWLNYTSSSITRSSSEFYLELDAANISSYPGSGTTWTDISGNFRNGTLVNGPTFSSVNGGEINFTADDYIGLPANQFSFGTGQFSIEAWVQPRGAQVTNNAIFFSQSSNASGFYGLGYNTTNGFFLATFDGTNRPASFNLPVPLLDNWYHVIGTRDSTNTLRVWVNTKPPSSTATSSLSFASADPRIGMNPATSGERWEGRIAIFRVYNRALSYVEIIEKYNWNRQRFGL